jgi:hypothetical protein
VFLKSFEIALQVLGHSVSPNQPNRPVM